MFNLVLWGHSMLRWAVLVSGLIAVYRGWRGRAGVSPWTSGDTWTSRGFVALLDVQFAAGLLLWLYSPISIMGIHEPDLGLGDRVIRFWTFEHPLLMLAAVVLANIGLFLLRRRPDARRRHRTVCLCFGTALALVLVGIPWSFLPYGRPLFWLP